MTVTQQLLQATERIKALETDLSQNTAALKEAETKLAEYATKLKAADDARAAQGAALADSNKAKDEYLANLTEATARINTLEQEATTVEKKAAELLGRVAAPPVQNVSTQPSGPNQEELWQQYASITDPRKKNEFYAQHREAMTPAHARAK